jgi:hypothetical protein
VVDRAEGEQVKALGGGEARGSGEVGSGIGAVVEGAEALPGAGVPNFDGVVITATGQVLTVGTVDHRPNPVLMAF